MIDEEPTSRPCSPVQEDNCNNNVKEVEVIPDEFQELITIEKDDKDGEEIVDGG